MKRILVLGLSIVVAISMSACYSTYHSHGQGSKKMPPGQAKKYYGEQSARDFAPGQQKKKNRY
ncbi:MAG: quinol oxidase subunit 4 [Sphingobacterium sp.]|uniref:quinol oxidase subunit 4 n=1 Tax=unclassified Sphingobacterium TaxID=2609468 RepID=UPI00283FE82A|nr:quinol oxidase subunit 4 [Sphingobacterium sp.]MDR3011349.1 quinol oxidase subunit 4 [Sphingobacterium sp.]